MRLDDRETKRECLEGEAGVSAFQRTQDNLRIKPSAYRDLLRNRDFLRLWAGQMVSAIGDWVIVAVLFAFVDQISGGKSYAISIMMLCKFLPAVLLGFLAGIAIDRLDRKRTLIMCDLSRALLVLVLPFATNLPLICVLVFVIETFTIVYGPAKDASIPDLVEPEQLTNANSLNMLTLYASMAFGTAIAGSIIGLFAWLARVNPEFMGRYVDPNKAAFVIDSLTFLVSAWLIYHIGFKRPSREERVRMSTDQVRSDFREGLHYLRHNPLTRIVLILTLTCFLGGGTIYVLTVGFVKYVLGGSNSRFMYILTTLLFGMMGGSMLAGALKDVVRKERLLGLAISGFGLGVVVFSLLTVAWLSFVVVFLGGTCMGYAIVGMVTLLHENLEEEFRGRAFATIQVIMRASIFLSIMLAGPLADLITGLGRRLGLNPVSLWIVRVGGSYSGPIDGREADFRFLLNGPQIILFVGGMVILGAGLFGHRAFHRYFGWELHDKIFQRRRVPEPLPCVEAEEGGSPGGADGGAVERGNGGAGSGTREYAAAGSGEGTTGSERGGRPGGTEAATGSRAVEE
ncbi:MAG: MFS transporter [Actinomycetota bacterium]|nr:MFS transporter [Actinomycetota bacterium]